MDQIIRELMRQFAGEKLPPEQLKGLIRAGYVYRNGEEHHFTPEGRAERSAVGRPWKRRPRYARISGARRRPLAPLSRSKVLPDIPTVSEFLPGYEAMGWNGVGVPKDTPTEIIDKLNREVNMVLSDPKIMDRIADLGATVMTGSSADFGKLIADETEKWARVVKFAGIKAEWAGEFSHQIH